MRGNEYLFRTENHCNSESTGSGRNPVSHLWVMIRNFYKKKKGNNYVNRRKTFLLVLISQLLLLYMAAY